jgi:hypothetical protein
LYELIAGLVILVVVVGFIRLQLDHVKTEITDPDQSQYQIIPATTPVIGTLCTNGEQNSCLIPTIGPLFGPTPKPRSNGLSLR